MPNSDVEARLVALHDLLGGAVTGGVLRNEVLPQSIPAAGLVIQRDGSANVAEVTLPLTYHLDHRVEVEIYAQGYAGREAVTDARRQEIGAAIASDRTLGGLCDWIEAMPVETDDQRIEGADGIRVDLVAVTMFYATTNPLT